MCDYRYGFLRCEDGGLEGGQAPEWAMWCPKCNTPKMLADALFLSVIAFQQALQICAKESPEAARQWIASVATWPARSDAGAWLGPQMVTQEQALTMLNDAMDAAGLGRDIEIAAVSNELQAVRKTLVMEPGIDSHGQTRIDAASDKIQACRDRLNDLIKPKEHA